MKVFIMTRGIPGSGKSTLLERLPDHAKSCIISPDNIRLQYSSLSTNPDGSLSIPSSNDSLVWNHVKALVEHRMRNKQTVILDATSYSTQSINKWKSLCQKYQYKAVVWDFVPPIDTDGGLDSYLGLCRERNSGRDNYKKVPDSVLDRMMDTIRQENGSLPSYTSYIHIDAHNPELPDCRYPALCWDQYRSVYVFGDIHGCYEPLHEFFRTHPFSPVDCYVFAGDYLDRGTQNREVMDFLMSIRDEPNVWLIYGNHEQWIEHTVRKEFDTIRSKVYKNATYPEIQSIDPIELKRFCRKLVPFVYFEYHGKEYFINHGGMTAMPDMFTPMMDMVRGIGKYEDSETVGETWTRNHPGIIQIHGHRNIAELPFTKNGNVYNLEGKVEYGGNLRVLEISHLGGGDVAETPLEIRNTVHCMMDDMNIQMLIKKFRNSPSIMERKLDDGVSSFNFTRKAFWNRLWDNLTVRTRGLFIDTAHNTVVARGYPKFFNLDEVESTKMDELEKNLKFPLTVYRKENGYLGLLSWDYNKDGFFFATKSTNRGEYASKFREMMETDYFSRDGVEQYLEDFLKNENATILFEVIDPEFDPHIIKYDGRNVVLLDIVRNTLTDEFLPYRKCREVAGAIHCEHKETATKLENLEMFRNFIHECETEGHEHIETEGFVIEDSSGFRFKVKLEYYRFWKNVRTVKGNPDAVNAMFMEHFHDEIEWLRNNQEKVVKNMYGSELRVIPLQCDCYGWK